jgi:hypothetical protein
MKKKILRRIAIACALIAAMLFAAVPVHADTADPWAITYFGYAKYISDAADGELPDHYNSILPFVMRTDMNLSPSNVKISSSSSVVKVKETCFYKAPGKSDVFNGVYMGGMYLQTGANAGKANITVTVTHPSLKQPSVTVFPITVKPRMSGMAVLTSNITQAGLFDGLFGSGICNWTAQLRTGKSLTLKPYVYVLDEYEYKVDGKTYRDDAYENSFDNIYPLAASKVSWSIRPYGSKKQIRYIKLNKKTGKVTFKKKVTGTSKFTAGPDLYLKYKDIEASYYINGIRGPNKHTALWVYSPSRPLLLRGEQRVLRSAFPVLQSASGKLKWSSSNKKVAGINSLGIVKAKDTGKVSFTAKFGKKKKKVNYRVVTLETFMQEYYTLGVRSYNSQSLELYADEALRYRW